MQKNILYTIVIVFSLLSKVIAQETKLIEPSTEWEQHGSASDSYQMGIDNDINAERENFFTIKSIKKRIKGFGGLSKTINPNQYLGKTIKMSGYLKSENVKSWAGLWMRVDELKSLLAFDNMYSRPIKNTTDWTRYEIVLYIPVEASSISYGVLLDGTGQIWFKDIIIEIVDDSTIETGIVKGRSPKNFTFESKAKAISNQIEMITTEEKKALKVEVEAIDLQVKDGKITYEKAQELKQKIAEERARNIENKLAIEEVKLAQLIQDKVEGRIIESDSIIRKKHSISIPGGYKNSYRINNDGERRTTSQFVFATGFNNLITDGAVANSDFGYLRSTFYEWGLTLNTRLSQNSNLLHLKYGLGFQYNMLHATDNRVFVDTGSETVLETYPINFKDNHTYFRNVYFVMPVHLEFDFSKTEEKDGKKIFKSHQGFRFGLGGFAGVNTNSKQFIRYELDGKKVNEKTKADFNVNDFTYGLSAYVGYKVTSLYVKYDLNPMFKHNNIDQNNVSLGIRFDFN